GVLPAGSANDFVKSLYPKIDLTILKALIDKGTTQRLDVGWVRFQHVNQQMSHRFFMNITDVGMGAEAVKIKEKLPRWLGAAISYFWAIIRTIALYKKRRIKAFNKSFFWEGKMINLVVAKGRYFGNGLGIAPNADLFDGKFSLVIIGNLGLLDYFKNLGTLRSCRKLSHPEVRYHRCKEITITSADSQEIGIEMDGEYIGETPINLKCLQSKITFLS
ncbi:MAG: hypothetical protein QGH06_01740, partial [Lutibacter sp.]|nr:hypothetical protein [Lutibacter sp.]